ncbi:uncharacterized protein Dana_GF15599 [Drosophila ananassae]|uniref:Uncharacterized protein n=1 Tax=Drosophila ananassae TaxID=7217 RepID=B3MMR3_DROAN|nr:uncharacterized protein LOC123257341 [Drosophila ananassae]EDV31954.2 uncharacterized protein Dana_GF15599 [Drosophila ananassae]
MHYSGSSWLVSSWVSGRLGPGNQCGKLGVGWWSGGHHHGQPSVGCVSSEESPCGHWFSDLCFPLLHLAVVASLGPAIFMVGASYAGCDRVLVVVIFTIFMGLISI